MIKKRYNSKSAAQEMTDYFNCGYTFTPSDAQYLLKKYKVNYHSTGKYDYWTWVDLVNFMNSMAGHTQELLQDLDMHEYYNSLPKEMKNAKKKKEQEEFDQREDETPLEGDEERYNNYLINYVYQFENKRKRIIIKESKFKKLFGKK